MYVCVHMCVPACEGLRDHIKRVDAGRQLSGSVISACALDVHKTCATQVKRKSLLWGVLVFTTRGSRECMYVIDF